MRAKSFYELVRDGLLISPLVHALVWGIGKERNVALLCVGEAIKGLKPDRVHMERISYFSH